MATGSVDGWVEATDPGGFPRARASDAERVATVAAVQDAVARGLLTHDEGGERMAAAFAARFRDQLPRLTADLPPAPPRAATAVGWPQVGATLLAQLRSELDAARAAGLRSRRVQVAALALLVGMLLTGVLALLGGLAVLGVLDHHDVLDF
jgi:hypothetical protein